MLIDGHGQAKVLSQSEILQLLNKGFACARDRALFAVCLYTACRISEARQMHYIDAFDNDIVRSDIVIRKENTKGKQSSRLIPTHPDLAFFLRRYYEDSLKLIELKKMIGGWTHLNLDKNGKITINTSLQCPRCSSTRIKRNGIEKGFQRYSCNNCGYRPREHKMQVISSSEPLVVGYDSLGVVSS
jgi:integrase